MTQWASISPRHTHAAQCHALTWLDRSRPAPARVAADVEGSVVTHPCSPPPPLSLLPSLRGAYCSAWECWRQESQTGVEPPPLSSSSTRKTGAWGWAGGEAPSDSAQPAQSLTDSIKQHSRRASRYLALQHPTVRPTTAHRYLIDIGEVAAKVCLLQGVQALEPPGRHVNLAESSPVACQARRGKAWQGGTNRMTNFRRQVAGCSGACRGGGGAIQFEYEYFMDAAPTWLPGPPLAPPRHIHQHQARPDCACTAKPAA